MKAKLTKIQQDILNFIKNEISIKGYPPSVREIGSYLNISSTSSIHYQLSRLEALGYIVRDPLKPRAMRIVDPEQREAQSGYNNKKIEHKNFDYMSNETVEIPIVGQVAAGQPILAVENRTSSFSLPVGFVPNNDCFMLTVRGSSMINVGILDGDYVVVSQQSTAENGEIVVALVDDDEATVKTFYREENCVRLQPENPLMPPIYSKNVRIVGKVVGVIRKL